MIDRRAFLARLGFGTVAAAAAANGLIDLERLLWVPGEKTIIIPSANAIVTSSWLYEGCDFPMQTVARWEWREVPSGLASKLDGACLP